MAALRPNGAPFGQQQAATGVASTAPSNATWRRGTEQMLAMARKIARMRERLESGRRAELSDDERRASSARRPPGDRPRPTSTS